MTEKNNRLRRDSLGRGVGTRQRPQLLRSSATEPSITAPNTIKGSLVFSSSPKRVADILSKMNVYSLTPSDSDLPTPSSLHGRPSDTVDAIEDERAHEAHVRQENNGLMDLNSACYYSFPSIEVWDATKQNTDKCGYV
jgi:hypothetical protein